MLKRSLSFLGDAAGWRWVFGLVAILSGVLTAVSKISQMHRNYPGKYDNKTNSLFKLAWNNVSSRNICASAPTFASSSTFFDYRQGLSFRI
jgi:predicted MFS family arabinose efflux permease